VAVQTVRQGLINATIAVAAAVPAQGLSRLLGLGRACHQRDRIRRWLDGIPTVSYILTSLLWALIVWRGLLYSALGGAKNLRSSWGGPTLAGAWATHLAITVGALLAVSLVIAWASRELTKAR
jgi:ABC-type sugar transport system permease subunit